MKRGVLAGMLVVLASCTSDEDDPLAEALDFAQEVRELRFVTAPRVERRSREEFLASSKQRSQAQTDREIAETRAVWGRLGFIPPSYDLRAANADAASVAAYYDTDGKALVLFDEKQSDVVVHELVHALQDQHFDLLAYQGASTTTDDAVARRAVVEGDATVAQLRWRDRGQRAPKRGVSPNLATTLAPENVVRVSEDFFADAAVPPIFLSRPAFVYPYGAGLVARAAGVLEGVPTWNRAPVDALFREAAPRTSEDVMRRSLGLPTDDRVDVGITRVPEAVAARYEIAEVDRIGAWYTYLLMREPMRTTELRTLALAWDGDQLVVLRPRALENPSTLPLPNGVVWTTIWDGPAEAANFHDEVLRVHRATASGAPSVYRAADGEEMWLETRAAKVVLVKGLPRDDMASFAAAAL